jgi:hypothetical protein
VALVLIALGYAWYQNGPILKEKVDEWVHGPRPENDLRQPMPLSPAMEEHLKAVQLVATLPPDTLASVALAEFVEKTRSRG